MGIPISSICLLHVKWDYLHRTLLVSSPSNSLRPVFKLVTLPEVPPRLKTLNLLDLQGSTHHSKALGASTTLSNMNHISPPQTSQHQGKGNMCVIVEDTSNIRTNLNASITGGIIFLTSLGFKPIAWEALIPQDFTLIAQCSDKTCLVTAIFGSSWCAWDSSWFAPIIKYWTHN